MRAAARPLLLSATLVVLSGHPAGQQREMKAIIGVQPTRAEVLASTDAIPAHIAASFSDPAALVQTASGRYLVFDRRSQGVYSIDRDRTASTRIVQIGEERGRIIRPTAFAAEREGSFVVVDEPAGHHRIQRFAERGYLLNGFTLPETGGPSVMLEGFVAGGIASVQFTGDSIFISQPQTGSLVTEYGWDGRMRRSFGALRVTGQEADAAVHVALNAGVPLVDPTGAFYFVFQGGTPLFRKYDQAGGVVFERHVEGRELDETLKNQPAKWPVRRDATGRESPAVPAVIRTAAVDPRGNLWLALTAGFVYVYSPDGEKVRTLQLRGAGPLAPVSLSFASASRLLVAPGCYIFDVSAIVRTDGR